VNVSEGTVSPPAGQSQSRLIRLIKLVLYPVFWLIRHPSRAAALSVTMVLVVLFIAVAGVWLWTGYHLAQARNDVARGHNAAAYSHLQKCAIIRPDNPEMLILSARIARRSGATDEAEALLYRYEGQHGMSEALVLERLLLRAATGDVEAVEAQLTARSASDGPDAELAFEGLVSGLITRFRWAEAYRHLAEWRARYPQSTAALLLAGKLEEQRQGYELAIGYYRQILEIDTDQDEARLRLATQLVENRRGDEALSHVEALRARLPNHPEVEVLWVRALALNGRATESRAALAECLRMNPEYPPALLESGGFALLDGDEVAAERIFRQALDLNPDNLVAHNQYAFALARTGKTEEAAKARAVAESRKADLERITVLIGGPLQSRPNDPAVHREIAQIALRAGQVREALRWFSSALQVDPSDVTTHKALALLYRELDKPVLSAKHRALAQRPGEQPIANIAP